jgi:outer membrane receptor for ferrienterochelin and colicins
MKSRTIFLACFALCLSINMVGAQDASVIRVLNENDKPAIGASITLQSLDAKYSSKPATLKVDENGEAINYFTFPAVLRIELNGYQLLQDTIDPGSSYTYHLSRLSVDLNEVVVAGQYDINTSDKSVYRVKVIDEATIQSMAAQNLAELLSNQLDIRLSQDNILGSSASIDGISGQNVKILIDGVNVIGRENGNIDLAQINLNNVERVEIIDGPMSVSYGTDAIGGLINIVTKKSSSFPWKQMSISTMKQRVPIMVMGVSSGEKTITPLPYRREVFFWGLF